MTTVAEKQKRKASPNINVTPLIDVLLVLLIIFMVITPLKPTRFKALVPPAPQPDKRVKAHVDTLVVTIDKDLKLKLNQMGGIGSVNDANKLSAELENIFQKRKENHVYRDWMENVLNVPAEERIEKTVFIKAPRSIKYGEVAKVIDVVKGAGANPVGLQVDALD